MSKDFFDLYLMKKFLRGLFKAHGLNPDNEQLSIKVIDDAALHCISVVLSDCNNFVRVICSVDRDVVASIINPEMLMHSVLSKMVSDLRYERNREQNRYVLQELKRQNKMVTELGKRHFFVRKMRAAFTHGGTGIQYDLVQDVARREEYIEDMQQPAEPSVRKIHFRRR